MEQLNIENILIVFGGAFLFISFLIFKAGQIYGSNKTMKKFLDKNSKN